MTLDEKLAQLVGLWLDVADGPEGPDVAPMQHEMLSKVREVDFNLEHGLGQLTRPFGTRPVDPAIGARALRRCRTADRRPATASASPPSSTRSA